MSACIIIDVDDKNALTLLLLLSGLYLAACGKGTGHLSVNNLDAASSDGATVEAQLSDSATQAVDASQPRNCTFDTQTIYLNQANETVETVTKDGKYFTFTNNVLTESGTLSSVDRYVSSGLKNGPCFAKTGTECTFANHAIYRTGYNPIAITFNESIVTGGQIFPYNEGVLATPVNLADVARYQSDSGKDGPCKGKTGTLCALTTRTVYMVGADIVEWITVAGTYFHYKAAMLADVGLLPATGPLTQITRYNRSAGMDGPCKGKTGNDCAFSTHAIYQEPDNTLIEVITVDNQYFRYVNDVLYSTGDLNTEARYQTGPCP